MPVMDSVVRNPNELIDQIIEKGDLATRKVFYSVLAKSHLAEVDRTEYRVEMSEIYSKSTIRSKAKETGEKIERTVNKSLVESSIRVDHHFSRLYLNKIDAKAKNKINTNDGFISPIEYISYHEKGWTIILTQAFKLYLVEYQRASDKKLAFTKGDKDILLYKIYNESSDKMYWLIRRQQWTKGIIKFDVQDLKKKLGKSNQTNKNFYHSTLLRIQQELKGTWTEFYYKAEYAKSGKGGAIKNIVIMFDKDEVLLNKIKLNFTTDLELTLYREHSIPVATIQQIKYNIKQSKKIKLENGEEYEWSFHYVKYTLNKMISKKAQGKVNDHVKYFVKALFEGFFAEEAHINYMNNPPQMVPMFGKRISMGPSLQIEAIPVHYAESHLNGRTIGEYIEDINKENNGMEWCLYKHPISTKEYLVETKFIQALEDIEKSQALEMSYRTKNASQRENKKEAPRTGTTFSMKDILR